MTSLLETSVTATVLAAHAFREPIRNWAGCGGGVFGMFWDARSRSSRASPVRRPHDVGAAGTAAGGPT